MTKICTLLKYVPTGHNIRFGVGKANEKEIARPEMTLSKITADNSDYRPYAPDSDFSIFLAGYDI